MTGSLVGPGFRLRRAAQADAEFLASLATDDEISPFLAALSAWDADA